MALCGGVGVGAEEGGRGERRVEEEELWYMLMQFRLVFFPKQCGNSGMKRTRTNRLKHPHPPFCAVIAIV